MATAEQKAASGKLMEAVKTLNEALAECSRRDLYVELATADMIGAYNPRYLVAKIETRETVRP